MTLSDQPTPFFLTAEQIKAKMWPFRESIEAYFATSGSYERSDEPMCIHALIGGEHGAFTCRVPGEDHPEMWLKDGKPAAYVFHPYGLTTQMLDSLVRFCKKRRLQLEISGWSWHFPLATLLVVITKPTSGPVVKRENSNGEEEALW